ncbi:MAG: AraC family transcriptional regulator [Sporosarcina sp.]
MGMIQGGQHSGTSNNVHITKVKRNSSCGEVENFFRIEEELLNHLFQSEKEEAQRAIKEALAHVFTRVEIKKFDAIKYYLIALSSIVARQLERTSRNPGRAFHFNVDCFMLINTKLSEKNMVELVDDMIEFYVHVLSDEYQPGLMHSTVNDVIIYINEKVESAITVEEIANKFGVSVSHLSRIFREHAGVTLVEYIMIRKIEESQYYLRFSEEKIASVSDRFHFCNQSYFTRVFKRYTGQTPKRFRSSLAGEYFRYTLPGEEK